MIKNILKLTVAGALALGLTACNDSKEKKVKVEAKATVIKIGATLFLMLRF